MINLDTHEWDFSKGEMYAINWLECHGFDVTIRKRYITKDIIEVSKDGLVYIFHLPCGDSKIKYNQIMRQFQSS